MSESTTPSPDEKKEMAAPAPETTPVENAPSAGPAAEKATGKPKRKVGGLIADAALVAVLLGVLGVGGYYVVSQTEKYRVPTEMEQAMQENDQLTAKVRALNPAYANAQNIITLNRQYIDMQTKTSEKANELNAENRKSSETVSNIERTQRRILGLQHRIRTVDASNRQIAYNMLPGMHIGDVTTTTGKAYRDATIKHLDKKLIVLSTPESMSRFPVKELVKENLPPLALYAFKQIDLVDMSDFDTPEADNEKPKGKGNKKAAKPQKRKVVNYEPKSGAPVLDTNPNTPSVPASTGDDTPDDGLVP